MNSNQSKTVNSIVKTWNGGEHILAGQRASELVYGGKAKADDALLAQITDEIPGIVSYIAPPTDAPVTQVEDQGGNPMSNQPENQKELTASNVSTEPAKDEQDAIDETLAAGREAREAAGTDETGSTALNPAGSDEQPKPAKTTRAKKAAK